MAKKKSKPIEEIKAEEVMVESVEEITEEPQVSKDVEDFINRKLMAINQMSDSAKAKRLAERVLRNRKG